MTSRMPRVWVLLGPRTGDNNQVLALAEALGLPFETRTLRYNLLRALGGRLLGRSLASLDPASRRWIAPPWPDLVIAIGRRSVPVARWIRHRNAGRTRLVRVGNPRMDPRHFDLVITTRQYPVPPGDNVLLLSLAMSRYRERPAPTDEERGLLGSLPRPHLLMAIGGATKYWRLPPELIADSARRLAARAEAKGGTLIIVGSPRTEESLMQAAREEVAHLPHCRVLTTNRLRFPVLLADADENFVTGDSVSMISEAVLAGRPVGLIPIELTAKGRRTLGRSGHTHRRDLRRFWSHLQSEGLLGTVDEPVQGVAEDPVRTAAARVRALLGDLG